MEIDLRLVDSFLRDQAAKAWLKRDVVGLMISMDNTKNLQFVADNIVPLRNAGLYEEALVHAYQATRVNLSNWPEGLIKSLFNQASRAKLQSCGGPMPNGPVVVYRGVAGHGRKRRIRGPSWTLSLDCACWFAMRLCNLPNPAIYTATVTPEEIYVCLGERGEQEIVVRPDGPKRLNISREEMEQRKTAWQAAIKAANEATLAACAEQPHVALE